MLRSLLLCTAASALLGAPALAQDDTTLATPLDLGVLQQSEMHVVQKMLYSKEGKSEVSVTAGLVPFDPYTTAPKAQLTFGRHLSESLGWEIQLGLGWGLKSRTYRELDSAAYGKVPEAYRYLASLTAGVQISPIYAKMAWQGEKIYHHDIYIPVVAGLTFERLVEPQLAAPPVEAHPRGPTLGLIGLLEPMRQLAATPFEANAWGPPVGTGLGARIFLPSGQMIRIEARDDVVIQRRPASDTWRVKQNFGIHVGLSLFVGS